MEISKWNTTIYLARGSNLVYGGKPSVLLHEDMDRIGDFSRKELAKRPKKG